MSNFKHQWILAICLLFWANFAHSHPRNMPPSDGSYGPLRDNETLIVYDSTLENGFEDYSWAARDFSNPSPVHSGTASIRVDAHQYEALSLHHAAFNADPLDTIM